MNTNTQQISKYDFNTQQTSKYDFNTQQTSRSSKHEVKKRKKIQKEHFYPNHFHREAIHDCMNEFGSMMKNTSYSKSEMKKIARSIKKLRYVGLLPCCSKHYFGMK